MSSAKPVLVDCPTCGKKSAFAPSNVWRPFCSDKCKLIDLGAWASDQYVVGGEPLDPLDPSADVPPERRN